MLRRNVVRRDVAAEAAAAERHGRVQSGGQADRAMSGGRVHTNAVGRLVQPELENDRVVLRVNGHGVTHAAVLQDLLAALTAFAPILHDVVGEHRAQLLDREREVAAHPLKLCDQRAGAGRHGEAAFLGDVDGRLADKRGIRQSLRRDQLPGQRLGLGGRQEVTALVLELPLGLRLDGLVDDHRVGRRAQHAVVERLAGENVVGGLAHVGARLDVARRVAWPDTVGGLARAVGRAHQAHAAGRENHRDLARPHQLLRPFERDGMHPADGAVGQPGATAGLVHDVGRAGDAAGRRRMRRQHDGAPRLDRDQDLVDRSRRGIRGGNDGRDHPERLGDFDDLAILNPVDHAHGLHGLDELEHPLRGKQVLLGLVGDHAKGGFFDRQPRQGFGVRRDGRGHGLDDAVDLILGEFGERGLCQLRAARERPGLGDRRQVLVGLWW